MEKNQINKIRNQNGEITTDNTEIQRIIRDYYEQLCANKMDHLEEMDKFLEKHNLLKLKQKKQNMNKPITDTKIESVKENKQTKNLPTNKSRTHTPAHRPQTHWNQKVDDVDIRNTTQLPHHQATRRMSTS